MAAAFLASVGIMPAREGYLGQIMVVAVSEGFAADQNGVVIGDEIIAVDGELVAGCTGEQVSGMLLGAAGSTVDIELDSFQERRVVTLTRGSKRVSASQPPLPPTLEPRFNFNRRKTPVSSSVSSHQPTFGASSAYQVVISSSACVFVWLVLGLF
ncbi:hypothetical protein T484DRAFT_1795895 [Baffinella frigidus]|nr:hypothetical protein T484DRAFT_1795895 [Cryptophyta sp. CCMP2293]